MSRRSGCNNWYGSCYCRRCWHHIEPSSRSGSSPPGKVNVQPVPKPRHGLVPPAWVVSMAVPPSVHRQKRSNPHRSASRSRRRRPRKSCSWRHRADSRMRLQPDSIPQGSPLAFVGWPRLNWCRRKHRQGGHSAGHRVQRIADPTPVISGVARRHRGNRVGCVRRQGNVGGVFLPLVVHRGRPRGRHRKTRRRARNLVRDWGWPVIDTGSADREGHGGCRGGHRGDVQPEGHARIAAVVRRGVGRERRHRARCGNSPRRCPGCWFDCEMLGAAGFFEVDHVVGLGRRCWRWSRRRAR